jgi:protein gp37
MGPCLIARVQKLIGIRRHSLCLDKEYVKHVLLSCPETKKLGMEFFSKKWMGMNEDADCRKTNKTYFKYLVRYLEYRING